MVLEFSPSSSSTSRALALYQNTGYPLDASNILQSLSSSTSEPSSLGGPPAAAAPSTSTSTTSTCNELAGMNGTARGSNASPTTGPSTASAAAPNHGRASSVSGIPTNPTLRNIPAFLNKLFSMVNDPQTDSLIRWTESGQSFVVPSSEKFGRELLPRFFKHSNFGSFVRQLNMYGFHKVPHLQQGVLKLDGEGEKEKAEILEFRNDNFQKGQPDLLYLIQRKKGAAGNHAQSGDQGSMDASHLIDNKPANEGSGNASRAGNPGNPGAGPNLQALTKFQGDLQQLLHEVSAIRRHQTILSSELRELQQSNQQLWQENFENRIKYDKNKDTIDKILKFLAGVFGGRALNEGAGFGNISLTGEGSSSGLSGGPVHGGDRPGQPRRTSNRDTNTNKYGIVQVPRKRQRLLLEGSPEKESYDSRTKPATHNRSGSMTDNSAYFEEINSDDEGLQTRGNSMDIRSVSGSPPDTVDHDRSKSTTVGSSAFVGASSYRHNIGTTTYNNNNGAGVSNNLSDLQTQAQPSSSSASANDFFASLNLDNTVTANHSSNNINSVPSRAASNSIMEGLDSNGIDWNAVTSILNGSGSINNLSNYDDPNLLSNLGISADLLKSTGIAPSNNFPSSLSSGMNAGSRSNTSNNDNSNSSSAYSLALSPANFSFPSPTPSAIANASQGSNDTTSNNWSNPANLQALTKYTGPSSSQTLVDENNKIKERMDNLSLAIDRLVAQFPAGFDFSAPSTSQPPSGVAEPDRSTTVQNDDFDFSQYLDNADVLGLSNVNTNGLSAHDDMADTFAQYLEPLGDTPAEEGHDTLQQPIGPLAPSPTLTKAAVPVTSDFLSSIPQAQQLEASSNPQMPPDINLSDFIKEEPSPAYDPPPASTSRTANENENENEQPVETVTRQTRSRNTKSPATTSATGRKGATGVSGASSAGRKGGRKRASPTAGDDNQPAAGGAASAVEGEDGTGDDSIEIKQEEDEDAGTVSSSKQRRSARQRSKK